MVSVVEETQFLYCDESMFALDVLVLSLQLSEKWSPPNAVFEFLDNCFLRYVQKPVHYYDVYSKILTAPELENRAHDYHIGLLLITILEQWPFLVKRGDDSIITSVAIWLVRYIELSYLQIRHFCGTECDIGARRILEGIRDQLKRDVKDNRCRHMVKKSLREPSELGLSIDSVVSTSSSEKGGVIEEVPQVDGSQPDSYVNLVPPGPSQEEENHFGLNRWTREDIQDAITDGAIEELFLCLCSKYTEIRQQALTNVVTFMGKLEVSSAA